MEGRKLYVRHPSYTNFRDNSDSFEHEGKSKLDGAPGPGSGRYPLGSGKNPYQDYRDRFTSVVNRLSKSEDGTLTAIGKLRYRTTNKYKFMTDEELQSITARRKKEKEYEDVNRQVSPGFRFQEKVGKSVEDAVSKAIGDAVGNLTKKALGSAVQKVTNKEERQETIDKISEILKSISIVRKSMPKVEVNSKSEPSPETKEQKNNSEPVSETKEQKNNSEPSPETKEQKNNNSEPVSETKEQKNTSKLEETKNNSEPSPKDKKKKDNRKVTAGESKESNGTIKIKRDPEKPKENKDQNSSSDNSNALKDSEISRIKAMRRTGMSIDQIAKVMNISTSTIEKYTKK